MPTLAGLIRRWPFLKLLVPHFKLADLGAMLGISVTGGLIGGVYGILHDQLTYSLSPEYFTKLKFHQFSYANLGYGDRFFAGTIGFLATWWIGFFAAWFLARKLVPQQPRAVAYRQVIIGFGIVLFIGVAFGLAGFLVGGWRGPQGDYSAWDWITRDLAILDVPAFVQVATIHQGGYFGGLVGLVVALLILKPKR